MTRRKNAQCARHKTTKKPINNESHKYNAAPRSKRQQFAASGPNTNVCRQCSAIALALWALVGVNTQLTVSRPLICFIVLRSSSTTAT